MANLLNRNINKISNLFQPTLSTTDTVRKTKIISKSYENLINYGFIKQVNNGMYAYLPLAIRVLNKLTTLIDNEMEKIGAQKIMLPALASTHLWKRTKRFDDNQSELFTLKDRSMKQYLLSPTYEEIICDIMTTVGGLSSSKFPLRLYQISNKWRDEIKPRHGFLRSREFLMKDLYTFDLNLENAQKTYDIVCEAYNNIFKKIGIEYIKAIGDPGSIGGLMSHEYHYKSNIGEDLVLSCSSCQYAINKTICKDNCCPNCKSTFLKEQTTEVGHTFLLNTKYTEPLNVKFNKSSLLVMGSYGLGLSRIFTMMVEILSTDTEIRWPKHLAPYTICIIPPKKGSKEEFGTQYVPQIIEILDKLNIDMVLNDETDLTIGKRLVHARLVGFPYVIVIGKLVTKSPPLFEIHDINNSTHREVTLEDIPSYFSNEDINKGINNN